MCLARVQLLRRLHGNDNSIVRAIVSASAAGADGWVSKAWGLVAEWAPEGPPCNNNEWDKLISCIKGSLRDRCGRNLWEACGSHTGLAHYRPGFWLCAGELRLNQSMHNRRIPVELSRAASRLLCGGQGLRGADVKDEGTFLFCSYLC